MLWCKLNILFVALFFCASNSAALPSGGNVAKQVDGVVVQGGVSVAGNFTIYQYNTTEFARPPASGSSELGPVDNPNVILDLVRTELGRDILFTEAINQFLGITGLVQVSPALENLKKAEEAGSGLAALWRSIFFENGWFGNRDMREAKRLMLLAADRGVPGAQELVQHRYFIGYEGYEKDLLLSTKYLEMFARNERASPVVRGQKLAQLAGRYFAGEGVTRKDECRGLQFRAQAAILGDAYSMRMMGLERESSSRCNLVIDKSAALDWYLKAAAVGDKYGAEYAGMMYLYGWAGARDNIKAEQQLLRAGTPRADANLAWMYMKGLHGSQAGHDFTKAMFYARRGVSEKNSVAMINQALLYFYGLGVPHNMYEAFRLNGQAADAGEVRGRLNQVVSIINECVSSELLPDWYSLLEEIVNNKTIDSAARLDAQALLGNVLAFGRVGVAVNDQRGRQLLQQACASGHGNACINIAYLLQKDGEQVPESIVKKSQTVRATYTGETCRPVLLFSDNPDIL